MRRKRQFYSTAIALVFTMIIASSACAQLAQGDDSSIPYRSIMPDVESTIERTAVIALRHISQARADIHREAWASARRDVAESARLLESIRDDLSTSTVKNHIDIARKHLEFEPAQRILQDLPPIYSSLDMISIYLPTDKAKMHIDRAKAYLEKDDKREADRELALADRSLIIIEVELPLLRLQQDVTKAQKYLSAKEARKADEALQVAEHRALSLYTGLYSPLFQANRNSWLAFRNYSTEGRTDTGRYLKQARGYLGKAESGGSAKVKEEVGKLSQEVAELEKKLAGEGKVAESELKSVWEKSKALSERSAAYLAAVIPEEETTLKGENNLIEAKLHVEYAETYQVTTAEPAKAVKELDIAAAYLKKAKQNKMAVKKSLEKMDAAERAIQALKSSPEKNDSAVQERYESLKDVLSTLIQEL
ncbi:MAG: hypothetical protein CXR31_04100 [Geobacter sp.]|nr:MAG: hypothetical protein CXR31_04100 [Geobacter sp.]